MIAAGWFLENAWLIPMIPAVAFGLIILIGKRMPMGGSELGIASMAAATVLAVGVAVQWIQRTNDAGEEFVEPVIRKWVWWQNSGVELTIGEYIDGLAVMALGLVAFISLLVQIYSLEYVRGDRRYTHFFAAITLFSAGMLVMVLAENMVQLILGWEIMGLCSFLLIGHWWEEESNARAALKAFFTVRVGDIGLLVGTALLYWGSNSWAQENLGESGFSIRAITAWALSGDGSDSLLLWTAVALFIACIGKSGQFPLHTWLPDAMAGPTPVSSLLHSSTMVVAGVFLVARLYPVFWEGFSIPDVDVNFIVVIAGITIIISGLLGLVQDDIKKVLAYSTVGQLAYMMLGLGAGAWLPAVFHIFTHAFFKCCLFLCAGSVSHSASHHSFDMKKDMGGLWRKMPITTGAWIVSSLALVGVFPFAGFMSKDEIIDNVGHGGYSTFMWIALVGAFITAAYTVRATYLTFFGEPRGAAAGVHHEVHTEEHEIAAHDVYQEPELQDAEHADAHAGPHESPKLLLVPICVLAVFAFGAGWTNAAMISEDYHVFSEYVEPHVAHHAAEGSASDEADAARAQSEAGGEPAAGTEGEAAAEEAAAETESEVAVELTTFPEVEHAEFHWFPNAATSLLIVGAGLVTAWGFCVAFYGRRDARLVGLTQRVPPLRWAYTFVANKYYLDALYEGVIVRAIAHPIARAAYWINQHVIDGIVNAVGIAGRRTGAWVYRWIDQGVVDGAVNGSGIIAEETGEALRPVQSGRVNNYGALLFGAAAVGAIVLVIVNV
jgi:NADH-quinone oxidoreductase subunit L